MSEGVIITREDAFAICERLAKRLRDLAYVAPEIMELHYADICQEVYDTLTEDDDAL